MTFYNKQIPIDARDGTYTLQVDGSHSDLSLGTGFSRKALVNFSPQFLTIMIQTNQLVYNIRQSSK